ncbi:cell wall hydrolase [Robertmurraya kyonggiensis]|uniref:Cell wall hydrolase n=1 Tax=Robertmurraya kyonggiensis TaxID=1037680 RepID=A0A4U1DA48_9BACI|nr:cell wall hydrolase [Robertmurraya kyonggiensis]TKC19008.1 cell wall hydrolase [Robertmurraya kyonggiensis]
MNNIYKKKIAAACVATLAFLGLQSTIAFAEEKVEDKIQIPEKPINQDIIKENVEEKISDKEKELLSRLVEAEAKGESYEGKVAVAEVVLNRVESEEFPDTVKDVVYEKTGRAYAFSPVQNGSINKPASEEAKEAVEEAVETPENLNNAIYFYNPEIATDNWIRSRKVIKKIDNHAFAI